MKISRRKTNLLSTKFCFDKERSVFQLLDNNDEILTEYDTELMLDDKYNPSDFVVKLLYNARDDCTEDSIYQVKIEEQRIGWIFPVQSIHSKVHSFSENIHFLRYAFIAWVYLLTNCEVEVNDFNEFDLFNSYKDCTNIFVMDLDNCRKVNNFEYEKYIISLFQNGYSENGEGNLYSDTITHSKTLKLKRQSEELDDIPYIVELFKKQVPLETNTVSRFHIYYQLIEILIAKVFDNLFVDFIDALKVSTDNLFDKKEELNEYANEKKRVCRLCNEYCKIDTSLRNALRDKCNELLKYTGSKMGKEMHDSLYLVRCLIVHRMYVIDEKAEELLRDIDNMFLDLSIQLILSFSIQEKGKPVTNEKLQA